MTEQATPKSINPTHRLYLVSGSGEAAKWTEIGAAWPHSDGKGFSISAEAGTLEGRVVLRKIKERSVSEAR
ncbi:hypothetical protein WG908_15925 [Sphingobium sp. AN641]|uniref:hypothetical protein n=1 Tax=Sphingobium sp. AN641 TaxID=3133443 RepID=UPI0030BCDB0D